jgi:hypothetical protein
MDNLMNLVGRPLIGRVALETRFIETYAQHGHAKTSLKAKRCKDEKRAYAN